MGKLKLQPDPTFKAKVPIPVPGAPSVDVEFTFKYRNRDELKAFMAASDERAEAETVLEMCTGWELTDAFTRESIDTLLLNYITASRAIFETYIDEHLKARAKN